MNFQEYQKLSIRTLPELQDTYGIRKMSHSNAMRHIDKLSELNNWSALPKIMDSTHMVLGMMSEVNELNEAIRNNDLVNIAEELADICWYVSGEFHLLKIDSVFNLSIELLEDADLNQAHNSLIDRISKYSDLIKKEFAYRKRTDPETKMVALHNILINIRYLSVLYKIDIEKALDNNINKLKVRFPDKFNQEDAIIRDLGAERKELEKE